VPVDLQTDWQRVFRLSAPASGGGAFSIDAAQSIIPLWSQGNTGSMAIQNVAVDFRGDDEVSCTLHSTWSGALGELSSSSLSVGEWSVPFGGGNQILGPDQGKKVMALDLRLEPPVIVYQEVTDRSRWDGPTLIIEYTYTPYWHRGGEEHPLGSAHTHPGGYSTFSNHFFVTRLARDTDRAVTAEDRVTLAVLPQYAAAVADVEWQANALYPDDDLFVLTGISTFIEEIGGSSV
jgi:hypothetical protein